MVERADAFAVENDKLLVSNGKVLRELSFAGKELKRWDVAEGSSACCRVPAGLAVGYGQGVISILTPDNEPAPLDSVPSDRVERLVAGPGNTLIAGFAKGQVGVWDLATRQPLLSFQAHGRLTHLRLQGNNAIMMTELGDVRLMDFGVLETNRCALLEELWSEVPAVWSEGRAVRRLPPTDHPCRTNEPP